jgi:hypothetical protein
VNSEVTPRSDLYWVSEYNLSEFMTKSHDICISSSMLGSTSRPLRRLVQHARRGLSRGFKPVSSLDGSGGTYFLHDSRKNRIAVFKPADEEPYAPNNPRGYLPQPGQNLTLRDGAVPGECCVREVAAYLLDHGGFAGVPMTTLAEARHPAFNYNGSRLTVAEGGATMGSHSDNNPFGCRSESGPTSTAGLFKVGSLQEYVDCDCTMDDISYTKISDDAVHRIAILDIRLLNADRNAANLLCRRLADDSFTLVPIDHGYCLRSKSNISWMDWAWLDWPQLKKVRIVNVIYPLISLLNLRAPNLMLEFSSFYSHSMRIVETTC